MNEELRALNSNGLEEKKLKLSLEKQANYFDRTPGISSSLSSMTNVGTTSLQPPYSNSDLSLADAHLPDSMAESFKKCSYYYKTDSLIAGAVNALATFPNTDFYVSDSKSHISEELDQKTDGKESKEVRTEDLKQAEESPAVKFYKKQLTDNVRLYSLITEIGIDYHLLGNCIVYGNFKKVNEDGKQPRFEWNSVYKLDPSKIIIDVDTTSGKKVYKWDPPDNIKKICKAKQPENLYNSIPSIIKEAIAKNQAIVLDENHIYHFSRPGESVGSDGAWGTPLILSVFKLLEYRNILRKAQEALAREHIVPLRIFYLKESSTANIMGNYDGATEALKREIAKQVVDPNYKIISPLPVEVATVGGQGRSLLLTPEIEQVQNEILCGLGVPREFIFGGVSYSGTSLSLKILENQFQPYRLLLKDFVENFLVKKLAQKNGEWKSETDDENLVSVKFSDMKFQDDIQHKQLIVQLNGSGKVSNELLYQVFGLDSEKEKATIKAEALEAADMQFELQKKQVENETEMIDLQRELRLKQTEMEMQVQSMVQQQQQQMMPPQQDPNAQAPQQADGAPEGQGDQNPGEMAQDQIVELSQKLKNIPEAQRGALLQKLPPQIREQVVNALNQKDSQIDMTPMPTQKPPRRGQK